MKIRIPRTKVQSAAPILDLTCVLAHSPNALLPPALLTRATRIPSSIRKIKIPAVPEAALIKPSLTTVSTVLRKSKSEARIAPERIPIKSEEKKEEEAPRREEVQEAVQVPEIEEKQSQESVQDDNMIRLSKELKVLW
jgi:hypothetical protein